MQGLALYSVRPIKRFRGSYRPPLHHSCRSSLKTIPINREIDPNVKFENRDFLHRMNQEGVLLNEQADEKIVEKAFENIDKFNEKYRISKFILD